MVVQGDTKRASGCCEVGLTTAHSRSSSKQSSAGRLFTKVINSKKEPAETMKSPCVLVFLPPKAAYNTVGAAQFMVIVGAT